MTNIKHWKDVKFELVYLSNLNRIMLKSNLNCPNILTLGTNGIRLAHYVGYQHGFDLDTGQRLKVYRGYASSLLCKGYDLESELVATGRTFYLWKNAEHEQLVINSCGSNMLLIDKSGLHRFPGVSAELGFPVDPSGNLLVLK